MGTPKGFRRSAETLRKISQTWQAKRPAFWDRVRKADGDGCWEWIGPRDPRGYGLLKAGSHLDGTYRRERAHRVAYEQIVGPIPDGLDVLHRCDNEPCVRADPDPSISHLFVGTQSDNVLDRNAKGRSRPRRAHSRLPDSGLHIDARPKRKTNHPKGEAHHNAKITRETANAIRAAYATGEFTMKTLSAHYGISRPTVAQIVHGRTWND